MGVTTLGLPQCADRKCYGSIKNNPNDKLLSDYNWFNALGVTTSDMPQYADRHCYGSNKNNQNDKPQSDKNWFNALGVTTSDLPNAQIRIVTVGSKTI